MKYCFNKMDGLISLIVHNQTDLKVQYWIFLFNFVYKQCNVQLCFCKYLCMKTWFM